MTYLLFVSAFPSTHVTQKPWFPSFHPIKTYSETWTFSLTNRSAMLFLRPGNTHYFKEISVSAQYSFDYTFRGNSSFHLYGYLYNNTFDPRYLSKNQLASGYFSDKDTQFRISHYLKFGTRYILIVTTRNADITGPFTIVVSSYISFAGVSLS